MKLFFLFYLFSTYALKFVSIFSKMSLGAAKMIQNKSFKDNDCLMTMFYNYLKVVSQCFTIPYN